MSCLGAIVLRVAVVAVILILAVVAVRALSRHLTPGQPTRAWVCTPAPILCETP